MFIVYDTVKNIVVIVRGTFKNIVFMFEVHLRIL